MIPQSIDTPLTEGHWKFLGEGEGVLTWEALRRKKIMQIRSDCGLNSPSTKASNMSV